MLTPRYIIGFTGHRSRVDDERLGPVIGQALGRMMEQAGSVGGRVELVSSVAEGSDTLCVEIAAEMGIPTHIILPLQENDFMTDFTSPEAWNRSNAQIARARMRPGVDSVTLVSGEKQRPECYANQGTYMLEVIDMLIAVWDGQVARGQGGTAEVVAQAKSLGIPVMHIDSTTAFVQTPADADKVFVPDPIIVELKRIEANGRSQSYPPDADPDELQSRLDQAAVREAGRFRPTLVCIILLHGLAALLAAAITFSLPDRGHWWELGKWLVTAVELLLVSSALFLSMHLHRRHTQETWIKCRFACEIVRGLRVGVPLIDPLNPLVIRHCPEWRRFALSAGLLVLGSRSSFDSKVLRDAYLGTRLSEDHPESQIIHYRKKQPSATLWWEITGCVGVWSARLAPVFVLLSLLNKGSKFRLHDGGWHLDADPLGWIAVGFLPIALPLAAGIAGGVRQALDAGRRKHRYPEMVKRLKEMRVWLSTVETDSSIRSTVNRCEEILLDELIEWRLVAEITGEH